MSSDDVPLVEKAVQGDREAFAALVRKHQKSVIALGHHILGDFQQGEDAAQEAFLRAFKSLSSLRDPAKFRSWIGGIAYKVCITWIREEKVKARAVENAKDAGFRPGAPDSLKVSVDGGLPQEMAAKIVEMAGTLPTESRSLLALKYLQGMSYAEIAELLQVTEEKVKSRLHVARTRLRELMGCLQ